MRLPNCLVIGPMKAGTTWLHFFLESRCDVCLPYGVKETFFFDRYFDKGSSWYGSHFGYPNDVSCKRIVEVAPSYFHSESAPQRIRTVLGEIPLIVTLRDPVKRSWSHYLHLRRYGYTREGLRVAARHYPQIINASRYAETLSRWEDHFPPCMINAVWQEDLAQDPEQYAGQVCKILGLPFTGIPLNCRSVANAAAEPPSPTLSAIGRRTSYALRSLGLYGPMNVARRLGLRRVFFGHPDRGDLPMMSDEEADWLRDMLWKDYESLSLKQRRNQAPKATRTDDI